MSDPGRPEAAEEVVEATIDDDAPAPGQQLDTLPLRDDALPDGEPIRVVPMVVDSDEAPPRTRPRDRVRRALPLMAIGAFALAAVAAALHVAAVVVASGGDPGTGTVLAWLAIGTSAAALAVAVVAIVRGPVRRLGVLAAAIAVVVNPWIVLQTLRLLGGS